MIRFTLKGDFKNTEKFFNGSQTVLPGRIRSIFDKYGKEGVEALQSYTPKNTGKTASEWSYEIHSWGISWNNSNFAPNGTPIAILIQYGHGTRGGGYVQGMDYINPAIKPIFDRISDDIWREVQNL